MNGSSELGLCLLFLYAPSQEKIKKTQWLWHSCEKGLFVLCCICIHQSRPVHSASQRCQWIRIENLQFIMMLLGRSLNGENTFFWELSCGAWLWAGCLLPCEDKVRGGEERWSESLWMFEKKTSSTKIWKLHILQSSVSWIEKKTVK